MENKKEYIELTLVEYCDFLNNMNEPIKDFPIKDKYKITKAEWESWQNYRKQATKNFEYLMSPNGQEKRNKDFVVVDEETFWYSIGQLSKNSDRKKGTLYIYNSYPNSEIIGIQTLIYNNGTTHFPTGCVYRVLKSIYKKWKKEKGE